MTTRKCSYCRRFFAKYRCNCSVGECDCPKNLGLCRCHELEEASTPEAAPTES